MVLKIAHRGGASYAPENTMAAFNAAMKRGIKNIEFDVQLSKDRVPMVMHDDTVDRTTNGKGKVNEMTLAQLKSLTTGDGEDIPTLDEALAALKKAKCTAIIEIKEPGCEKEVLGVIIKRKMVHNSIIMSFKWDILVFVKELMPKMRTAWIVKKLPRGAARKLEALDAFAIGIKYAESHSLSREKVKKLQKAGYKVFLWTIDTKQDARAARKLGADGIVSNEDGVI